MKPSIVLIEDDPATARLIEAGLSEDYQLVTLTNAPEGLTQALALKPLLIMTAVRLAPPIAELRNLTSPVDIPILLLAAASEEEQKIKLLREGASDVLTKPFSSVELCARVNNLVNLKKARERNGDWFDTLEDGFCIVGVIFDENQKPVDYRFLEINSVFEKQTGLKDAKGKLMRDLAPHHEQHWFDLYGKVALTGRSIRFDNRANALQRWYEVYAFRIGPPENHHVAIFFNNILDRKWRSL